VDKQPLLVWNKNQDLQRLLKWHGLESELVSSLIKVKGFENYNLMIDLNSMFSSAPQWHPVDRTGFVTHPWKQKITRPWQIPKHNWTLDQAIAERVSNLELFGQHINVFWSGGIDSTAALTGFLKHLKNRSQLRILYTPWSTYEHPDYLKFLDQYPEVEKIDVSGEVYLYQQLDGIFITGDSGDESHASLDHSFFNKYGYNTLLRPWKDFFSERNGSEQLINFCQEHFLQSGYPIETVLEARWWFYNTCKLTSILHSTLARFFSYNSFDPKRLLGFYDCTEYENYIYWNINDCIIGTEYYNWKQNLKNYCCNFDGFIDWRDNKSKYNSAQLQVYQLKKMALDNHYWIGILEDGTRIFTPSLPILTQREFNDQYGTTLSYLFNEPD
jgi:hypothetical protein